MGDNKFGVVIPAAQNRMNNTIEVLKRVFAGNTLPEQVIVVCDGWESRKPVILEVPEGVKAKTINIEKYQPDGKHEQPRNVGVRHLDDDIDYVWFLDSDVIPSEFALTHYDRAAQIGSKRILIGPYDWMPGGHREPMKGLRNDPRWDMFNEFTADYEAVGQLNFALACFSGNLVWPVEKFKYVGGFWNEINMGRCEDGELGLRAASFNIPMSVVSEARGWHLDHPINMEWIEAENKRDIPLLNKRHPWVEEKGLVVSEQDGARFDIVCPDCKEQINTVEIWGHKCQN